MANHARGLWGYSGATAAGSELTIQSTGLGGPSVAVVLTELAELGMRRAVRIGTCRALDEELEPGALVVAEAAITADGVDPAEPARELTEELLAAADLAPITVASTDLYYDPDAEARGADWRAAGADAVDMGTEAAFTAGRTAEVNVASALVVVRAPRGEALTDKQVEVRSLELGRVAARAFERLAIPGA